MTLNQKEENEGFWREKKVFVTGATGILGSWLVRYLLDQHAYIIALIRDVDPQSDLYRSNNISRVSVVNGELEDINSLNRAINEYEIDTVFHLGAQTIVGRAYRSPLETFESNIRGTYNLLEACRKYPEFIRRIVIASSDKAYGHSGKLPYTEDMPLNGRHPYEVSKSCADMIAQTYHHTYGLPVAIARCGNIYGGGDLNWSRIVPGTIRSFIYGLPAIIRSDGYYVRDYLYVKDAVHAYMQLAEHLSDDRIRGAAFNFSTESPCDVINIVKKIRILMNCSHLEIKILDSAEGELRAQYLSAKLARSLLDWQPSYDLDTGLGETIDWYRNLFEENS